VLAAARDAAQGRVEEILQALGLELTPVADPHLCCGSAGTYSILQPELSRELKVAKLKALQAGRPDLIATANIGCLAHLSDGAKRPVRHWIGARRGMLAASGRRRNPRGRVINAYALHARGIPAFLATDADGQRQLSTSTT
jgi:hypothetical protein